MCHIILLFPVIGLLLFWIIPFSYALPLYLIILVVSGFVYFKLIQAMNHQPQSGKEAMISHTVKVLKTNGHQSRVLYEGETWDAKSEKLFKKGEQAKINGIEGLTLHIGKTSANQHFSSIHQS